jgi:LmbE family N-acetylglucosaminyl deacetylase
MASAIRNIVRHSVRALVAMTIVSLVAVVSYAIMTRKSIEVGQVLELPTALLVLAAHQDDAVIQAGGLAARNIRLGGKVHIAYLTVSRHKPLVEVRKDEAARAWSLAGLPRENLTFLGLREAMDWTHAAKREARDAIATLLTQTQPDVVVIPLLENGNNDHDVLSEIASAELAHHSEIRVLRAAEYNPYFVVESNPEKVLWFLYRLLPFTPDFDPNLGLDPSRQTRIDLSAAEMNLKLDMLDAFESQKDVIPRGQFGYPDLFDSSVAVPSGTVSLRGKCLSWMTLALLLLYSTTCFSIGCQLGLSGKVPMALIAAAAGVTAGAWLLAPEVAAENMILISAIVAGSLAAKATTLLKKSAGSQTQNS